MMRSVFSKTLQERRFFMLGWTIGFAAIAALLASFYPAMRQDGAFDALLTNMPPAFQGLIGNLADLSQFDTYIASQLFDIRMPLIAGIMAIILGLGLSVTDEEKGELRTILSLPVSRSKLFLHKWLAMVFIMIIVVLGMVAGVYAVLPFIDVPADISLEQMAALTGMTLLVMVTYGTIPFALGLGTGRRSVATAVSILAIIGSFILSTFGEAVDWLADYQKLSLLQYFPAVNIVKNGVELADIAVFIGVTFALVLFGLLRFRRRDVA